MQRLADLGLTRIAGSAVATGEQVALVGVQHLRALAVRRVDLQRRQHVVAQLELAVDAVAAVERCPVRRGEEVGPHAPHGAAGRHHGDLVADRDTELARQLGRPRLAAADRDEELEPLQGRCDPRGEREAWLFAKEKSEGADILLKGAKVAEGKRTQPKGKVQDSAAVAPARRIRPVKMELPEPPPVVPQSIAATVVMASFCRPGDSSRWEVPTGQFLALIRQRSATKCPITALQREQVPGRSTSDAGAGGPPLPQRVEHLVAERVHAAAHRQRLPGQDVQALHPAGHPACRR